MSRPSATESASIAAVLPLFDGFPYLIVRVLKVLRHLTLLPSDWPRERLQYLAGRQAEANRLDTCLVLGPQVAVYCGDTGAGEASPVLPTGGILVTGRLLPPEEVPELPELLGRKERLNEFLAAHQPQRGYLMGDLTKGGRPGTVAERIQLEGTQPGNVPRGLTRCPHCRDWYGECLDPAPPFQGRVMRVHCRCKNDNRCARCGDTLAERKLNANYYQETDGQIWHVPGFCGLSHRCPSR